MLAYHLYRNRKFLSSKRSVLLKIVPLIILTTVSLTRLVSAQQTPSKSPLKHSIQTYIGANNTLFVNQSQGYNFSFTGDITNETDVLQEQGKPTTFSFPEGETVIQITSANGQTRSFPIVVDGTAPKSTLSLLQAPQFQNENTLYVGKNLSLQFDATDASSGVLERYWALNNNAFNPFQPQSATFLSNGTYTIYFYSVDQVGNVESVQSSTFEVDVTGPKVEYELIGLQNLSVISPTTSISLTSTDNASGTKKVYYWFDDGSPESYSTIIPLNDLPDGEHMLYAYASDQVENIGDTLTYSFYLDRTPPSIQKEIIGTVYQQDASVYISAQSSISLFSKDNKSGTSWIKYQINQSPDKTYSQPIRLPDVSGNYSITYYTADVVGNFSEKQSFKVYVDHTKPQTNITYNGYYSKTADGYAISPKTNIELEAIDLESGVNSIQYSIDGVEWKMYTEPLSFSKKGAVTLHYQAIDEVKNTEEVQTLNLMIKDVSNALANAKPEKPNANNSAFIKTQDTIQGPEKEIFLWISTSQVDSSEKFMMTFSSDSSFNFPISLKPNTETTVAVHIEEQEKLLPIIIDASAPVTLLEPEGAISYTNSGSLIFAPGVTLSLFAKDNISGVKQIYTSENGGRYQLYSKPLRGYFNEQEYVIRFYSVDNVGNEEPEQNFIFNVDATAPITTHSFISNFSGSNLSRYTELSLSASDNMSGVKITYIQLNNNQPIPYKGTLTLGELGSFTEAFNTLYYYSEDYVGNIEQRKQINFKIDLKGPNTSFAWKGKFHQADSRTYIHPSTELLLSAKDTEMEIRDIFYSVNSSTDFNPYTTPIGLEDLENATIRYFAIDELGNRGDTESFTIKIDSEAPVSNYSISGNTLQKGADIVLGKGSTIRITSSDDKSGVSTIKYSINTENLSIYSSPISFSSSGKKIIRFKAEDYVGNVEEVHLISVLYDQTAPQIDLSFSKEPASRTNNTIVIDSETLVSIKSIDTETEVKSLEFKLNNEEFSTYFRPLIITQKGIYTLTVKSIDLLDNFNEQQINIEIR